MLVELVIRKMALIEESTLAFGEGLNVITGETGAGKSLLVGALELLLGQRPRRGMVRAGARQLLVEGRFVVPRGNGGSDVVENWLSVHFPEVIEEWAELGEDEDRELILGRSVTREGKGRAHVNHRPVTQRALHGLAGRLFEVHGQNDHQRLLDPAEQLRLLDLFGGLDETVARYRELRAAWLGLAERSLVLEQERKTRADRLDLARFQRAELEAAKLDPKERTELTTERDLLRHAGGLEQQLGGLIAELRESEGAVSERLERARKLLEQWARDVAPLAEPRDELAAACVHVDEAVRVLRACHERLELDPARLELVEARLAELERLERKYNRDGAGLVALRDELAGDIARLEQDERDLEDLGPRVAEARAALLAEAGALRRARKAQAGRLEQAVHKAFAELGLERAEFGVRLGQRSADDEGEPVAEDAHAHVQESLEHDRALFGERGIDKIEFLLAANPGEPAQRLRQVASGGEAARIMLALRSVLVKADEGRTLVFDEIDAGVGGRLGPAVGTHMKRLARRHQVLCVTHLPAIAAQADRHLRVTKTVKRGRTHTSVDELSGDARVEEVADMIAGGAAHETARAEARRLIGS